MVEPIRDLIHMCTKHVCPVRAQMHHDRGGKQAVDSEAQTNWHSKDPSNLNVTLNMEFFELFLDWAMKK